MPKSAQSLALDIEAATRAIRIHKELSGPAVPENPLARLIADTPDEAHTHLLTRNAILARMRTARVVALRRHFDRQHLTDPVPLTA